jgi:hypothetical protein
MTAFALDRDLLVLEPALLRDVGWAGQRVLSTTGTVAGTTLTLASGSFADAGVGPGAIVLFDGLALEVVAVLSATGATVSVLRSRRDGPAIAPPAASARPVRVYTFGPQLAMVHRQVLAMAGIDPDGSVGGAGPLTEAAVTNPGELVRLEALGALHLIYAAAGAPGSGGLAFAQRAEMYRQRYSEERERVLVMIDTDGDGIAETSRRPSVFAFVRG